MQNNNKSLEAIALLAREQPGAIALVCALLLLSGLLEAFGISAIFPLISVILEMGSDLPDGAVGDFIRWLSSFDAYVLALIVVASFILKSLVLSVTFTFIGNHVADFAHKLRISFIDAMMKARVHYILSKSLGENLAVLSNDSTRAAAAYISAARTLAGVLQVSIYSAYALWLSTEATLLSLVTVGALFIAVKATMERSRKAGWETMAFIHDITKKMGEALRGVKEAKATAREKYLSSFIISDSDALRRAHATSITVGQTLRNIQDPVTIASALICVFIFKDFLKLEPGYIMFILAVYYRLMASVNTMLADYQKFLGQEAGLWAIQDGIKNAKAQKERPNKKGYTPSTTPQEISFKKVSFAYAEKQVLRNMSFKIPAKKITMLKGESGRGKTTCIDMICHLIYPDSGEVTVGGRNLASINTAKWRRNIGYVDQFPFLFKGSIRENILLDLKNVSEGQINQTLRLCHLESFIRNLPEGLDFVINEGGTNISGGQRQRIAIARSVIRKPAYLILDEPTSALDQESAKVVLETLKGLSKTMSVIMISHSPLAESHAHQVIDFDKF